MPKTPIRGHAAQPVSLQISISDIHCRHLERALQGVSNTARLRGSLQVGFLVLRPRRYRDSLFQRAFRQEIIGAERLVARAALASAANNLSPARLGQLGSPGQRAVQTLYDASSASMKRDVRVGQVRSAIALLAGARKKRTFRDTPVKIQPSRLAQNGATALASADSLRRVQLNRFCMDSAASGSLPALLAGAAETRDTVAASLAIFRAAVQSFILETVLGGKPAPQETIARQIRKGMDSPLLRLFLALWRRAAVAGKIGGSVFPWFDAVDWLVGAMHAIRPTSPGATRAPKSPRVRSPAALLLRRAQTAAAPALLAATISISSPTRQSGKPSRQLRSRTLTGARTGAPDQPDSPFKAGPRPGRQGRNVQLRYRPPAPTALADNAMHIRYAVPASKVAGDTPISPGGHLRPGATLGDIAHHLARQASATSGTGVDDGEPFSGPPVSPCTPGNAGADSSASELPGDASQ